MGSEFLDDAASRMVSQLLALGISAEVAQMVAAEWQASIARDWGGDRPYIGKHGDKARAVMSARNAAILRDYQAGERFAALARKYRISRARVCQIVAVAC